MSAFYLKQREQVQTALVFMPNSPELEWIRGRNGVYGLGLRPGGKHGQAYCWS